MLGIEPIKKDGRSVEARIQKKLEKVASLPEEERKMVLDMIDLLLKKKAQ